MGSKATRYDWWHSLDLGDGEVTQGHKSVERLRREAEIAFAHGIKGKSVLDIGAWDGFFSFEAERRGASRVLATDWFVWGGIVNYKPAFDYAHARLASRVESQVADVFDLSPARHGQFDTVLLLGVLYHLKNPLGGLEIAASMARETLIIETHVALLNVLAPAMRYHLGAELSNDPTNFWSPNLPCLNNMLLDLGFSKVEFLPSPVSPYVRTDANLLTAYRQRHRRIRAAIASLRKPTDGRVFALASR
jgi:tRNA (mo5U34)-methyltransferase